jgi:hypothetical protein
LQVIARKARDRSANAHHKGVMGKKIGLAALGYIVGTFILGFVWHLVLFKDVYDSFGVYDRDPPLIPMGLASMAIQGFVLAALYARYARFAPGRPWTDALAFNLLAGLFFVSGTVVALAAKADIQHLGAWFGYNIAFSALQFLLSGAVFGAVFHRSRA